MATAAAATPTATMIPAAVAWNVCTGTRPMWRNGVRSIIHFGMPSTEPTRYQRNAAVDEPVGDCRARSGCDRVRKGSDTQEQKRDGYAVGAGLEHSWERDVDPLGCCTRPGEQAGEHRQGGGGESGDQQPPAEPAASADRKGEQRFQPFLGFLLAGGTDLRAHEQADGQDDDDEHERQVSRGVMIDPVPNLAKSFWIFVEIPADEMLVEILPRITENAANPNIQVARLPRSLRSACAVGEDSSLRCGAAVSAPGGSLRRRRGRR